MSARKGRRNEYKSIEYLESIGYQCVRSAGSRGCWDIVAFRLENIQLVQVKSGHNAGTKEKERLRAFQAPANCIKAIHRWDDHDPELKIQIVE